MKALASLTVVSLLVMTVCAGVQASTYTWAGATGADWSTAGSWSPSGPPGSADTAAFATMSGNPSATITGTPTAAAVTMTGAGVLTLGGAGTLTMAVTRTTINAGQVLTGSCTFNQAAGQFRIAAGGALGGTLTVNAPVNGISLTTGTAIIEPGQTTSATHGTAGTITLGGTVAMASGGTMYFDLSNIAANCDLIQMTGSNALQFGGYSTSTFFNIFNNGGFGLGTYDLIKGFSTFALSGSLAAVNVVGPAGTSYSYAVQKNGNALQLVVGNNYTWTGTGTDWGTTANWTSPTGVTIPSGSDGASFAAGASVNLNGSRTVTNVGLSGAWSLNGPGTLVVNNAINGPNTAQVTINSGATLTLNGTNNIVAAATPQAVIVNGGTFNGSGISVGYPVTLQNGGTIGGTLWVYGINSTGGTISPGNHGTVGTLITSNAQWGQSIDQSHLDFDLSVVSTPTQNLSQSIGSGYCNDYVESYTVIGTQSFGTSDVRVNPLPGFASSAGANTYTLWDFTQSNNPTYGGSLSLGGTVPSIPGVLSGTVTIDNSARKVFATFTRNAGATFAWTGGGGAAGNWWNSANWDLGFIAPIAGDTANVSLAGSPTIDLAALSAQTGASTFVTLAPTAGTVNLSGSGAIAFNNGTLNVATPLSVVGGQTIQGNGTISGGSGTAVNLAGGTIGGSLSVGNVVATGGTIGGTANVTGSLAVNSGSAVAVNSTIAPAGVTINTGGELSGSGTINQGVTLAGGMLDGSLTVTGNSTSTGGTVAGTPTFNGTINHTAGVLAVNGALGGSGLFTVSGGTVNGSGTTTHAMAINSAALGGTLSITGNLSSSTGQFWPGNAGTVGTIHVTGNVTLDHATSLTYDLGAPGVAGAGDLFDITGNLSLDGTLNVNGLSGFAPGTFRLFNYTGSLAGSTLTVGTVTAINDTYEIDISTPHQVNLIVYPPLIAGDVNRDGLLTEYDIDWIYEYMRGVGMHPFARCDVSGNGSVGQEDVTYELTQYMHSNYGDANLDCYTDFTDFQVLLDHWQAQGEWTQGDFNGDGIVDFLDFQILLNYWNPGGANYALSVVPEPAALSLLALGGLAILRKRVAR